MHLPLRVFGVAGLIAASALPHRALSQTDPPAHDCRFVMIPMHDGVSLNTSVCEPRGPHGPLPFLLTRTPYGIAADTVVPDSYRFFAADGYIFVSQDIRGRYRSEGQFIMNHPLHDPADAQGVDESTDTYDTVAWLLKNVAANNGRVGVLGVSYPGFLATMAGINPHPAVKAISPQAPMTDTWMGDDFFHQGAFRLSYGFEYAGAMELSKDQSVPVPIGSWDTYNWYLQLGPLYNVAKYFHGKVPTWEDFVAHPAYDDHWKTRAVQRVLTAPAVATLTVGGWWDQEDRYGPLATYNALERGDTAHRNFLVMGPWNHGGWRRIDRRIPVVDGGGTQETYLRDVEAPWFAYYLKDKGSPKQPEALVYDAGVKRWRSFDTWPPKAGATARSLYLHAGGSLSFSPPEAVEAPFDQYISDPAHPVPYRPRPIEQTYDPRGSRWRTWETEDQRFVDGRPDVVSWVSEPLTEGVLIAGNVTARLVASTTGRDADWVVKLIDVFPDSVPDDWQQGGYQLMVAHEIMRGRYRKSFSAPEPLQPNTPLDFTVDLHQQSYQFQPGHRIMVQVQSTWFPLYDRNPQTWVPNIFQAKASDFKSQTHRIWHTPARPSRIEVTVMRAHP